jgi:predicted transcriptional regulator
MMLTPLELDIMKPVWRQSPITVREVQQAIRPGRQLAYTTVLTIMDRLYHKGFLTRTLRSRAHFYEPVVDYTEVRDEAVESLIKSFFGSKEELRQFLEDQSAEFLPRIPAESPLRSPLDETLL